MRADEEEDDEEDVTLPRWNVMDGCLLGGIVLAGWLALSAPEWPVRELMTSEAL